MEQLPNSPLQHPVRYAYRGKLMASIFEAGSAQPKEVYYSVDFAHPNLLQARWDAIRWWKETDKGASLASEYVISFATEPVIKVSLVKVCGDTETEYDLVGGGSEAMEQTLEIETQLYGWDAEEESL